MLNCASAIFVLDGARFFKPAASLKHFVISFPFFRNLPKRAKLRIKGVTSLFQNLGASSFRKKKGNKLLLIMQG